MGIFYNVWQLATWLFSLVATPLAKIHTGGKITTTFRWTLHLLAVVAIVVGLGFLNYWLQLDKFVRVQWSVARQAWLPILFLLVYAIGWLAWWLLRLAESPRSVSPFPEIDKAWQEGIAALDQAGIDLEDTPIFVVLGRPRSGLENLLHSPQSPLVVHQSPRRDDAPLHFFANRDAVYLCLDNASLLGQVARRCGHGQDFPASSFLAADNAASSTHSSASSADPYHDDTGTQGVAVDTIAASPPDAVVDPRAATEIPAHEAAVALLETPPTEAAAIATDPLHECEAALAAMKNAAVVDTAHAQVSHIGRLIRQARAPYCPINGVVVALPHTVASDEHQANEVAFFLDSDLESLHQSLQVRCATIIVLTDIETLGQGALVHRFPAQQRHRRLGVTFPNITDADRSDLPKVIAEGVDWLCRDLVPGVAYRLSIAGQAAISSEEVDRFNRGLYDLLRAFRRRSKAIQRLLVRGVVADDPTRWQLAGCYLAATGVAERDQAFTGGLQVQLQELQNHVRWTNDALRDDAACNRWTLAGYFGLAAAVAASIFLVVWSWTG